MRFSLFITHFITRFWRKIKAPSKGAFYLWNISAQYSVNELDCSPPLRMLAGKAVFYWQFSYVHYQNINALSRDVLIELVDHIEVCENGNSKVRFKFADEPKRIVACIKVSTDTPGQAAGLSA